MEITFGQVVKARRSEMGLTQGELARRVGCASVTVRKIEYGNLRPSVQIAERLAMSLNIPLEERADFVRLGRVERVPFVEPRPTPSPLLEEIGIKDLSGRTKHATCIIILVAGRPCDDRRSFPRFLQVVVQRPS